MLVLDHVANVVLLDFPDELGLRLSSIRPQLWYSAVANQVLQLLIAVGVIDLVVLLYRLAFGSEEFYGTVFETAARCRPLANYHGQLRREGKLDTSLLTEVVDVDHFRRAMHERIRHYVYAGEYRTQSLKNGGGTAEGALRWL